MSKQQQDKATPHFTYLANSVAQSEGTFFGVHDLMDMLNKAAKGEERRKAALKRKRDEARKLKAKAQA